MACNGFGRVKKKSQQEIYLPAGFTVDTSYTVSAIDTVSGKKLDVFARLEIAPSKVFRVESYDILCEYPVGKKTAEEGGTLDIPGPRGWVSLVIPPKGANRAELVVAGQGLKQGPSANKNGNLKVHLKIVADKMQEKEAKLFLNKVAYELPRLYKTNKSWWNRLFG
jgi:DnaJ-class molecular chaperone